MDHFIINDYLNNSKRLIPLKGKVPIATQWVNMRLDYDAIFSHDGNLGWALDAGDLVVDVDPKNGGKQSWDKLVALIPELAETVTVHTPSGGFHCYLRFEGDQKLRKQVRDYPGIDFLTHGTQCVIAGSKTGLRCYEFDMPEIYGFRQFDAPAELIEILASQPVNNRNLNINAMDDFEALCNRHETHEDDVVKWLDYLDPSCAFDDWVQVGMALHSWDPTDSGLDVWERWSSRGENWEAGATSERWKYFRTDKSSIKTIASLSYLASQSESHQKSDDINTILVKLDKLTDSADIKKIICPLVKQLPLDDIDRSRIAGRIKDKYKELGDKVSIADVRKLIKPAMEGEVSAPEWCKSWIYINDTCLFYALDTYQMYKAEAFNLLNGKKVPDGENGGKQSAVKYVSDHGYIPLVGGVGYFPFLDGGVVNVEGRDYVNTFNPNSIPAPALSIDDKGQKAINIIKKHLEVLCGSKDNAWILEQWLAHQVQFLGKKILWAPVIQGIQGVGKSFIGALLKAALGDCNVGTVSPSQVVSDYNGWASGSLVNVLEELRVKGHNRYEAVNALKPLITDRKIQVVDKFIRQHETYNTSNYICFTNDRDALPVDQTDRRWWIVFNKLSSLDDIKIITGVSKDEYFPMIWDALRANNGAVVRWLMTVDISDKFLNYHQAPASDDKDLMILTEEAMVEGLQETKDLIEKGGEYYCSEVICSSNLFNDLSNLYPDLVLNNYQKNKILKKLGYSCQGAIKINSIKRTVWVTQKMENEDVRNTLLSI
jgi:hypothetical protein